MTMFSNQLTKLLKCNSLFSSASLSWLVAHYGSWYKSVTPPPLQILGQWVQTYVVSPNPITLDMLPGLL